MSAKHFNKYQIRRFAVQLKSRYETEGVQTGSPLWLLSVTTESNEKKNLLPELSFAGTLPRTLRERGLYSACSGRLPRPATCLKPAGRKSGLAMTDMNGNSCLSACLP